MDSFNINYSDEASNDYNEAIEFYEKLSIVAADNFINAFDEEMTAINAAPKAASIKHEKYRARVMKKYPYIIAYEIDYDNNNIYIYRIYNTYKDPSSL